jgi:hypothetical protein
MSSGESLQTAVRHIYEGVITVESDKKVNTNKIRNKKRKKEGIRGTSLEALL